MSNSLEIQWTVLMGSHEVHHALYDHGQTMQGDSLLITHIAMQQQQQQRRRGCSGGCEKSSQVLTTWQKKKKLIKHKSWTIQATFSARAPTSLMLLGWFLTWFLSALDVWAVFWGHAHILNIKGLSHAILSLLKKKLTWTVLTGSLGRKK